MSETSSETSTETGTAPETLQLEVVVDRPHACSRILKITVPAAEVDRRLETAMGELARETVLPGFRRGKAPRALVERRLGTELLRDTEQKLLSEALGEAVRREDLKPLGDPELADPNARPELKRGEAFHFEVEVEVMPEFETPAFDGFKVEKPVGEIPQEMIEREVDRQRRWFGNPERISGPFETLDRMIGRAEVFREGAAEAFFTSDEALAVVPGTEEDGRGQFLGILVDGLHGILAGRKVGDTVEIEAVGPEGHELPEVRGARLKMVYAIRDAERIHPASEEETAMALGLPDAEQLRPQVRIALEERQRSEQRSAMREQVAERLVEAVSMELPEKLSQRQVTMLLERQRSELLRRGFDPETLEMELARTREESAASVANRLRLSFILARIAEELEVTVSEGEMNQAIHRIARQRGERPEKLRQELAESGRLGSLAVDLREQRVLDRIIDRAEISEVPIETWNAAMQAKREAAKKR